MFDYYYHPDKYYMYYLKELTMPESSSYTAQYDTFSNKDFYLGLFPENKYYVSRITDSLETMLHDPKSSGHDVSDYIIQDKERLLGTSVQHLKDQIHIRAKIFQDNIRYLDYKILQCESYLLNIHDFFPYTNRGVETKRANLGHLISRMESEKRQETVRWWSDQVRLYSELLKTMGEYLGVKRRSRLLSGE